MSADNYLYVRKREDGRYGISMRFASSYYADELDPWPTDSHGAPIPEDWVAPVPDDRYGIFENTTDAILAAHTSAQENWTEYGVTVSESVLAASGDVA